MAEIDDVRAARAGDLSPDHTRIADAVRDASGERVLQFFHQWFGVYQHQTGKPGEYWAIPETLAGFSARLQP